MILLRIVEESDVKRNLLLYKHSCFKHFISQYFLRYKIIFFRLVLTHKANIKRE